MRMTLLIMWNWGGFAQRDFVTQPLGVDQTLTLVANSRGTELESREVGAARLGSRRSVCPGCDSQEVDCDGCDDMLQAGFDKTQPNTSPMRRHAQLFGNAAIATHRVSSGTPKSSCCLSDMAEFSTPLFAIAP